MRCREIPSVAWWCWSAWCPFQRRRKNRQMTDRPPPSIAPALPEAPPPAPPTAQPPQPPAAARPTEACRRSRDRWHIDVNGYFRAPMALGISSRPGPDSQDPDWKAGRSPEHAGVLRAESDGRLELLQLRLHAPAGAGLGGGLRPRPEEARRRRGRVDGVLVPVGRVPELRRGLGTGAGLCRARHGLRGWRASNRTSRSRRGPGGRSFGYFEKYDTYTLGRFRQIGGATEVDGSPQSRSHGDCRGRVWYRSGRHLQPQRSPLLRRHQRPSICSPTQTSRSATRSTRT